MLSTSYLTVSLIFLGVLLHSISLTARAVYLVSAGTTKAVMETEPPPKELSWPWYESKVSTISL